MPSFAECLKASVDEGDISREEAQALLEDWQERFAQKRLELGDGPAAAAAKEGLEKQLRADAAEARRRVFLTDATRAGVKADLTGYRDPRGNPDVFGAAIEKLSSYGTAGFSSLRGKYEAILSLAHAELADHMATFRRSAVLGRRFNRPLAEDVMRELHGEATGSAAAKWLAEGLRNLAEKLRQRFNAAGGAIAKLENWGWTHVHDRNLIARAGKDAWKDFIRPKLDPAKMKNPLTGEAMDATTLEKTLDIVWENIVSDSWARRAPTMQRMGRGAVASQRAEERYLVFKSADDWLAYDRKFGGGDPVAAWFQHIKGMARDIAAMESFGPNPGAMVEWMKQVVRAEIGKGQAGIASLAKRAGVDAGPYADWRIDNLYDYLRGRPTVSSRMANATGDLRNLLTSAQLGAVSILAALTDPFIERAARKLADLPMRGTLSAALKTFSAGTREQAVRAGFMADDFVHILKDEARYAGMLNGSEWSRWIADRALTWNFLKPMTEARRHVHQLEWQATLADNLDSEFAALPDLLRRAMQGFGIDATDWNVMRSAGAWSPQKGSAGFLRPVDIAALADGPALPKVQKLLGLTGDEEAVRAQIALGVRRVAEKYVEMVTSWTERAVPSGTPNARSFVTGGARRGTIAGELLEGMLQYKSFGLSFTTLQIQAVTMTAAAKGKFAAAKYAGGLAIAVTIGGALYNQIKAIADGKDPQDMRDARLWGKALLTGGGLGLFGDFLFADYDRNGNNPLTTLGGPTVSFAQDTLGLTLGNIGDLVKGEDTHFGRELRTYLGRYTPVVSSHWATRAAWNRIFLDQLQFLTDPEAAKNLRAKESALARETGQSYFWPPGSMTPERTPDFGAAFGR